MKAIPTFFLRSNSTLRNDVELLSAAAVPAGCDLPDGVAGHAVVRGHGPAPDTPAVEALAIDARDEAVLHELIALHVRYAPAAVLLRLAMRDADRCDIACWWHLPWSGPAWLIGHHVGVPGPDRRVEIYLERVLRPFMREDVVEPLTAHGDR